jgi:hypothetical protein
MRRLPRRAKGPARPRAARTFASAEVPPCDFLAAGLVDHMHTVLVPILLVGGVRLWDGLEGLEKDYEIEATSSPSGVTHVRSPVRCVNLELCVQECLISLPSRTRYSFELAITRHPLS